MMQNTKAVTAVFGSMLLVVAVMVGSAVAQSAATDTTTSQPAQSSSQESQSSQPTQPAAPPQMAPDTGRQSDSRTDVKSETRSERIVETERSKFLGMDPGFVLIVGAVLFIVVVLSIVAMTRKTSTSATSVETRRSSM
jgi:cobalamin biosynthesis Mg chelatase CobN